MRCNLCGRKCNVDRNNELGFCKSSNTLKISRAALHFFEEPCISGKNGSGTVFFSNCNLKCVFCQNYEISWENHGKEITVKRLSEIFLELQKKGANNINLVTPTHYVLQIIEALKIAKRNGLTIPIVYNTNSYETIETIKMLNGYIDIYLADFKYFDNDIGKKYSNVNNYFEVASKAINEMIKQIPQNLFYDNRIMKKGIIIRHLILPGYTIDSKKVIKYLYEKYKDKIYISIMNQYTPIGNLKKYPEINRTITKKEYDEVVEYAIKLGVNNGFIQEGKTQTESFIPTFNNEGV